ncbi:MAG: hypothetical protein AAGB04_00115 [Pseudomonadota bacterium]
MNSVPVSTLLTIHQGQNNGRFLSPRLWSNVSGQDIAPDGYSNGRSFGDNFLNFGALQPSAGGTASYNAHGGYGAYVDTATDAGSIVQRADDYGGLRLSTGAVDNHETWLSSGGNVGALGRISDAAGEQKMLIFEISIAVGQIADNGGAMFAGLAAPGAAAANAKADNTGVMGAGAYIGFDTVHADGDKVSFVYKAAGESAVTLIDSVAALTASTQMKLGFIFAPRRKASERIRIFVDNIEQATKVNESAIATATFPNAEWMSMLAGLKNGSASASTLDVHWWEFFQEG